MSGSISEKISDLLEEPLSDDEDCADVVEEIEEASEENAEADEIIDSPVLTKGEDCHTGMDRSMQTSLRGSPLVDSKGDQHPPQPQPPKGRVARALKGKIKYILLVAFIVSIVSFKRYAPPINMPVGYDVDDGQRPGKLYNQSTIKHRRPVVLVPGFLNSALEIWQHDACADGGVQGSDARLFRERMLGPQMLLMLLRDPKCFIRHLSLHNVVYGADPEAEEGSNGRRIRVRSLNSIDSGDYVVPSYWAWAKIIRSFADIGYDPNGMLMLSYDWRLSPALAERRDGHFHRMKMQIEELVRFHDGLKAVMIAHSYGGITSVDFLNWAESRDSGWAERYIYSFATIGSPMLGTPKVVSALISGEIRSTAFLPSPVRALVDFHVPRSWRTDAFRTLPGAETLFIRGCDAIWPNVITLYNQTVVLRGSDVYEMVRTLTNQSNSSAMYQRFTEKRQEYSKLPRLPKAPSMNVFAFYGADLQTEVGYAYTLAQEASHIEKVEANKALMDRQLRQWLSEGGVGIEQAESALAAGAAAMEKTLDQEHLHHNHHNEECECGPDEVAAGGAGKEPRADGPKLTSKSGDIDKKSKSLPNCRRCAAESMYKSVPLTTPPKARRRDEFAALVKEVADKASGLWSDFVSKGETVIANSEAIRSIVDAFTSLDKSHLSSCTGETILSADKKENSSVPPQVVEPIKEEHKLLLHSRLQLAPPGILWRSEYLGDFDSGSDLALDLSVDKVEVLPLLQKVPESPLSDSIFGRKQPKSATNTDRSDEGGVHNPLGSHETPKDSGMKIPYRDHTYLKGVKVGPGDATVPLISLGYMSRAENGWRMDAKKVTTKEFFDGYTAEMHDELEQRIIKARSKPKNSLDGASDNSPPAATDGSAPAVETKEKNISPETEAILRNIAQDFLKSVDIRGGTTSADHVDLLGNYELIWDLLHIATGNDDKVVDRILTDIDERVTESQC